MIEYKVIASNNIPHEFELNELGREGWELVTILKVQKGFYYYYFKRNLNYFRFSGDKKTRYQKLIPQSARKIIKFGKPKGGKEDGRNPGTNQR